MCTKHVQERPMVYAVCQEDNAGSCKLRAPPHDIQFSLLCGQARLQDVCMQSSRR